MIKVVGFQEDSSFTSKDGERVSGSKVHVIEENPRVEGYAASNIWVKPSALNGYRPSYGDVIEIYYNRYGKVQSIVKVKG